MSSLEFWLMAGAVLLYVFTVAGGGILSYSSLSFGLLTAGLLCQFVSASIRWYGIGHPPIFGTYEAALQGSWFIALYVALSYKSVHGHFRAMVLTAIPVVILIILYGLTFNTERIPLTISERSLWVDFHALFSWLAFAPFTLAFCLSVVYLWGEARGKGQGAERQASGVRCQVPEDEHLEPGTWNLEPDILDELSFRYVNFGFINHTIMFALGCYYSSILYGTWWQWDPAESTSLITWLSVALYIHMRLFYNWRGRRAAWLFVVIFATVIFSYWGLVYLPAGSTYHVFDLEFKIH